MTRRTTRMDQQELTRISKFLSMHLRHRPEALGLELAPGGWVDVQVLLAACHRRGFELSAAQLAAVVADNDKQRFAFDETGTRIRAQQGHSVAVDLQLLPVVPPAVLYHGTVGAALPDIQREGLLQRQRHHVHLTPDVETARRVGQRRGRPLILVIDAAAMQQARYVFFKSGNGVWLTERVPPEFLREQPQ